MSFYKYVFLILLFMFVLEGISAHPHMAAYSRIEISFNGDRPEGLWMEYRWDRYFSADIIVGFDQNQDLLFDAAETRDIHDHAFINMENYGFFLYIRQGDRRISPARVSRFSARTEDGFVTYRFYVELNMITEREFFLSVFDTTYFCACYYEEDSPVLFSGSPQDAAEYSFIRNEYYPVYYDPNAPAGDNTIHDKWRPGLETAYPEEVRIVY